MKTTALVLLALIFPCAGQTLATPVRPVDPRQVLLTLSDGPARQQLRELHRPTDAQVSVDHAQRALMLAQRYIALGRAQADDRYYGNAAAVLEPLVTGPDTSVDAWVLKANVLQHQHQFTAAEQLLNRAIQQRPFDAQARLLRASIRFSQGQAALAQEDCQTLARTADVSISLVCLAELQSLTGKLDSSYALLSSLHDRIGQRSEQNVLAWMRASLGDMAERRGDLAAAEQWWRAALQVDADDLTTRLMLADLLLKVRRPQETLRLLEATPPTEGVLLRRALAAQRLADTALATQTLSAWREQVRRNGELGNALHLREQACGELWLLGDPRQALRNARQNWQTQREAADARIYLEAAIAAQAFTDIQVIADWLRHTGMQDVNLTQALTRAGRLSNAAPLPQSVRKQL